MGTRFLWDPVEDNIVKELDDASATIVDYTTEPYFYGDLVSHDRGGQSRFYHFDGLGSTMELTHSDGSVADTRRYSAFGETTEFTGESELPFSYAGQHGYYHVKAMEQYLVRRRLFDSARARWSSRDPLAVRKTSTPFYAYCRSQPVNRIDPSGLTCVAISQKPSGWKLVKFGASSTLSIPSPSPSSSISESQDLVLKLTCVYERTVTAQYRCTPGCSPLIRPFPANVCSETCKQYGEAEPTPSHHIFVTGIAVNWSPSKVPQGIPGLSFTLFTSFEDRADESSARDFCNAVSSVNISNLGPNIHWTFDTSGGYGSNRPNCTGNCP
jgi:RHS repeat-associated protein